MTTETPEQPSGHSPNPSRIKLHTLDIDQAIEAARQLQVTVDQGKDPGQGRRQQTAEAIARLRRAHPLQASALEACAHYIRARGHHWGEAHISCDGDAANHGIPLPALNPGGAR